MANHLSGGGSRAAYKRKKKRANGRLIAAVLILLLVIGVVAYAALRPKETDDGNTNPPISNPDGQTDGGTPVDTKPDDTKPDDTKPDDTKPDDTKPDDTKPDDTKPDDTKPDDTKPDDTKPDDDGDETFKPFTSGMTKKEQLALIDRTPLPSGKVVAMTFDDGPSINTPILLDGLKKRNVKATFFVLGSMVKENPSIAKRIVAEGHTIASHTWNHLNLPKQSRSKIESEMRRVDELFASLGIKTIGMIRPPYGERNDAVKELAHGPLIMWSVDPRDWDTSSSQVVSDKMVEGAHDGAIILCHDLKKSSITGALDAIDRLKAKGYSFVTVDNLLFNDVDPVDGKSYSQKNRTPAE